MKHIACAIAQQTYPSVLGAFASVKEGITIQYLTLSIVAVKITGNVVLLMPPITNISGTRGVILLGIGYP